MTVNAVAVDRDFARIQEWCNHWCMILNLKKAKVLVVIRSRTVNPPHGNLILSLGFHSHESQPRNH